MAYRLRAYLLLLAVVLAPHNAARGEEAVRWQQIAEDLSITRVSLWQGGLFSPEVLLVRTALQRYRPAVIRAADLGVHNSNVKTLSKAANSVVGINANFFDEREKPLGLVLSRGIVQQGLHRGGKTLTGVFEVTPNGVAIVNRSDFDPRFVLEAIQAGPRLLVEGAAVATTGDGSSYSRRAGVCIDKSGRLLFYISSGLVGITMQQLQELLRSPGVDCRNALNLDGGGSAQLFISKHLPQATDALEEIVIQGRDNIPVVLGLFIK